MMEKEERKHILYLGENGFPIGFAAIQRQKLIALGLVQAGCTVTVLSSKGVHDMEQSFPNEGTIDGINYKFTSGTIYKSKSFLKRNWLKFKGKIGELLFIVRLQRKKELLACIVSTPDFESLLWYRVWLKIWGVPLISDYCEYYSTLNTRKGKSLRKRMNHRLLDKKIGDYSDGIMAISNFLVEKIKEQAPQKPILKVPILCDFQRFNLPTLRDETIHLLYCGSPQYFKVVKFVLDSFNMIEIGEKKVKLTIVAGGGRAQHLAPILELVQKSKYRNCIEVKRNIPDEQIPKLYAAATALLIPLRDTIQDTARFPHKVGEALASKCAIVTTAFGEINSYDFVHQKTAYLASSYDESVYSKQIQYIIDYPEEASRVGESAFKLAKKYFDYQSHGKKIKHFIEKVN